MTLQDIFISLQAELVRQGALQSPMACGQIVLNVNDGQLAAVHLNAVLRLNGKPKAWDIPLKSGRLATGLDTGDGSGA